MEDIKKVFIFLFTVVGLFIFYAVLMMKLDVVAEQTRAKMQKLSADLTWGDYLYGQTVKEVAEKKKFGGKKYEY